MEKGIHLRYRTKRVKDKRYWTMFGSAAGMASQGGEGGRIPSANSPTLQGHERRSKMFEEQMAEIARLQDVANAVNTSLNLKDAQLIQPQLGQSAGFSNQSTPTLDGNIGQAESSGQAGPGARARTMQILSLLNQAGAGGGQGAQIPQVGQPQIVSRRRR